MPNVNATIAAKLKMLIKASPDSQSEIARKVGIKPQSINQYKNGSTPTPSTIFKICRVTGADIEWLLNDEVPIEPIIYLKDGPRINDYRKPLTPAECESMLGKIVTILQEHFENGNLHVASKSANGRSIFMRAWGD